MASDPTDLSPLIKDWVEARKKEGSTPSDIIETLGLQDARSTKTPGNKEIGKSSYFYVPQIKEIKLISILKFVKIWLNIIFSQWPSSPIFRH